MVAKSIMTKYKENVCGNGPETLDSINETDKEEDLMDIGMIGEEGNGYKRVNAGTKKRKKKHQGKEIRN